MQGAEWTYCSYCMTRTDHIMQAGQWRCTGCGEINLHIRVRRYVKQKDEVLHEQSRTNPPNATEKS